MSPTSNVIPSAALSYHAVTAVGGHATNVEKTTKMAVQKSITKTARERVAEIIRPVLTRARLDVTERRLALRAQHLVLCAVDILYATITAASHASPAHSRHACLCALIVSALYHVRRLAIMCRVQNDVQNCYPVVISALRFVANAVLIKDTVSCALAKK